MIIRKATIDDIATLLDIYEVAREYMRNSGNPNQWDTSYPSYELLENDIKKNVCFVVESDEIVAVFVLMKEPEPDYASMLEGKWRYDEAYGTVHRLASNGKEKGIASIVFDYCKTQFDYLRVDTHDDNKTMQSLFIKNGFVHCGRVLCGHTKDTRLAYDYHK